jgi:hypothetical protein
MSIFFNVWTSESVSLRLLMLVVPPVSRPTANNIANCADGKVGIESYGYIWCWDDDDDDDMNLEQQDYRPSPLSRGLISQCQPMLSMQWLLTRSWCGGGNNNDDINVPTTP